MGPQRVYAGDREIPRREDGYAHTTGRSAALTARVNRLYTEVCTEMPRILVADDDPVQLDLRKLLLETEGHVVSLASSTVEAVRHLREQGADLVIMDLRFPNADGTPD